MKRRRCKIQKCECVVRYKTGEYAGLCNKHYLRKYKYGDTNVNKNPRDLTPFQRFIKHIKANKETRCWEWTRALDKGGYGIFNVNRKPVSAHRWSYEYFKGKIPKGLYVLHKCDNPKCIRPSHLFLGTNQDNTKDRHIKGRSASGEAVGTSLLTKSEVLMIRRIYKKGDCTQKSLANTFNVSRACIQAVVTRRNWQNV